MKIVAVGNERSYRGRVEGFDDVEIARGVVYMANAAGAKFPIPERAAAPAANAEAAPAVAAAAPAAEAPAAAPALSAAVEGKALYDKACFACHAAGVAGAPKFGDKAAWAPFIAQGMETMVKIAISGKGAMPPKGGSAASDAEIHAAVQYMVDNAK